MLRLPDGASAAAPADPWLASFAAALAARPEEFALDPARAGYDVRCGGEVRGRPNRARVKAFLPRPGTFVLFLYKDSQTRGSDDRFAYGAVIAKGAPPDAATLAATLDYALSGLHPERRPRALKRAFPFDVPR